MPREADVLDTPAQFAARPSENLRYKPGYNQLKEFLSIRAVMLASIEADYGNEPETAFNGFGPRDFCEKAFQVFRKEGLVLTRPRLQREPELLYGFGFEVSKRTILARFGMPTEEEVYELGGKIMEALEAMLTPDAALVRQMESKSATMGTPLILEAPESEAIVPNTGGVVRQDLSGTQVFQRIVLIQRDEPTAFHEWACFLI